MGFNYASAFLPEEIDVETIKAASMVALMNYREEFPETTFCKVDVFLDERNIEVQGGPELRTYTFEELGFKV